MKIFGLVLLTLCFLPFLCFIFYRITTEMTSGFLPEEETEKAIEE